MGLGLRAGRGRPGSAQAQQVIPQGRAAAVRFSRKAQHTAASAAAGAYLLRTSHVDWELARVLRAYWELSEVEATFRSLKSELGLRPIWHRLDRRVCAASVRCCAGLPRGASAAHAAEGAGAAPELAVDSRPARQLGAHHHDHPG